MLNKDQYNQDEYNDYYAQEIRGAEIVGGKEEGGNGKKIAFIIILLLLIAGLGYFGWKSINGSSDSASSDANTKEETTQEMVVNDSTNMDNGEEVVVEEEKEEKVDTPQKEVTSQEEAIAKQVASITAKDSSGANMSQEDIANIVQMVMRKMNEEKAKASSSTEKVSAKSSQTVGSEQQLKDKKLMDSLSGLEVDSLSEISDNVDTITEVEKTKQASSSDTPNTYNKVVLDEKSGKSNDELSKLSDEISNIIGNDDTESKDNTYAKSIKKEVKVRKKEMRYVVVRKGDTLGKIAKRVYGKASDYKKIFKANPDILRRPDRIYIGQRLRVPE